MDGLLKYDNLRAIPIEFTILKHFINKIRKIFPIWLRIDFQTRDDINFEPFQGHFVNKKSNCS